MRASPHALASIALACPGHAQALGVATELKISSTEGGFGGPLDRGDHFGRGIAWLGDLDGAASTTSRSERNRTTTALPAPAPCGCCS